MKTLLFPLVALFLIVPTSTSQAQYFGGYNSFYSSSFSYNGFNSRSTTFISINSGFPAYNFGVPYGFSRFGYGNTFAYRSGYNPNFGYNFVNPYPIVVQPIYVVPIQWYNPPVIIYPAFAQYGPIIYPAWPWR